jgi:hypothetical protein
VRPLLLEKLRTTMALGLRNVGRVGAYRIRLRAGVHPVQRLGTGLHASGAFFRDASPSSPITPHHPHTGHRAFGWFETVAGAATDWHRNPFTGARAASHDAPWWTIPDFDVALGDVKTVWEASRLDVLLHDAQLAHSEGSAAIARLNRTLHSWARENPPYRGHNWKCGQEASIRVLHLALASLILDQVQSPTLALVELIRVHLRRIAPTLAYAKGQDNNHGTSEAAALIVGGSWLALAGDPEGTEWYGRGCRLLEERVQRLIAVDGSFSQYSVNYHRFMLDTLSVIEVWRRRLSLPAFTAAFRERARAASDWLRARTDSASGDAPNIGANDGADLLPLTSAGYRDFRPAVQLASALFAGQRAYGIETCREHLEWLGVPTPEAVLPPPGTRLFDDGGYAVLRRADATCVLRYPRFRFRPAHADPLHCDLFVGGENVLRDGGTYSYGASPAEQLEFAGVRGHSTVQFDGREPMPRLGRFLWGAWLETADLAPPRESAAAVSVAASYRDWRGARHARRVTLGDQELIVEDTVTGFAKSAVLRWRLRPGAWQLDGCTVADGAVRLAVTADVPVVRCALVEGWESRFYLRRTPLPVLEVEIATAGRLTTRCTWLP